MANDLGIMNISFRDETRTNDYLLTRESGADKFNIPIDMPEYQYMFPSEETTYTSQDSAREVEVDQYSEQQINNMVQDLSIDIENNNIKNSNVNDASGVPLTDDDAYVEFTDGEE